MTAPGTAPGHEILAVYERATQMLQEMFELVHQAWDQLITAVQDLLNRAQHFLNSDSIWSTIVQKFTGDIVDAIDVITALITKAGVEVDKIFTILEQGSANAIPVTALFQTALTMNTTILSGFSGLSADFTGHGDIDAWRGPAKISFDNRVKDQIGAADAVTAKVKTTAGWLAGVGASNTAYVTNLGHMGSELAGQLVTAAIDAIETAASSLPSYIIALQHLSEVIGTAVANTINWALDLNQHFAETLGKIIELTGDTHDDSNLGEDGTWPTAANTA
jgi:hypothetical protein